MQRKTSIIVLTYNQLEYTKQCLASLQKYTEEDSYELIVIDNASTDGTREWLQQQKNLKLLLNDENIGFPKGCNQGIALANSQNDILLLNNDTVVTTNWLKNLKTCLESDSRIGAVGPVCNQNENRQGTDFCYSTLEQLQEIALKNNISNPEKWEEKAFLIGYCLLIKREVVNLLGDLDEAYTPGYIEDNDLSLRIIQLGYRLMLCHDTVIHHFLGTSFRKDLTKFYPILYKNRNYFTQKWHFLPFAFDEIKSASFQLLRNPEKILELNCGIGVTSLALKYQYKHVVVEGIEENRNQKAIAKHLLKVYSSFEQLPKQYYDTILIGDALEKVENPKQFLIKLQDYLKLKGVVIGEIHNSANMKMMTRFLNKQPYVLYPHQKNLFTRATLEQLIAECSYQNCMFFSWYEPLTEEEQAMLRFFGPEKSYLNDTYYTFRIEKSTN